MTRRVIRTAFMTGLALVLSFGAAFAMPTFTGPLIYTVNTDKAFYDDGQIARVYVTLKNATGSSFTGTVTATVTGRGVQIGTPYAATVSSLAPGVTTTLTYSIMTPQNGDDRAYFIDLVANNGSADVDEAAEAIDVTPNWWTYPRQCWVSSTWTGWKYHAPQVTTSPDSNVASLNAWHCNNIQIFNTIYRWHQPYTEAASYTNGDLLIQSQSIIMRYIGAAKHYGMGTLGYVPMYSVNANAIAPNFLNDGSGAQFSWAMFTNLCGQTNSCKISDMAGNGGSASTAYIGLMDPTNVDWQRYWAQQVGLWIQRYGYDALFVDTYGNQPQYYNSVGHGVDYNNMHSQFINAETNALNVPIVINPASGWQDQDVAQSPIAYFFREVWDHPDDVYNYDQFHALSRRIWGYADRTPHNIGLDWNMGLDKSLANQDRCQSAPLTGCTFGLPGALYLEASAQATGAHHNWLADGDRFISNDDYPNWLVVGTTPAFVQAEYDYQNFGVAYEKLLRDNISDSTNTHSAVTGVSSNITATAGNVWQLEFHRSGFDILHLINFTGLNSTQMGEVQDPNGDYPPPPIRNNISVKMYVTPGGTLGDLYLASPDQKHGKPQRLIYTTGSDDNGSYITFTVPSLNYWDMIWLENGVAASDYAKL